MTLLICALPGSEALTEKLARHLDANIAPLEMRSFPDGELYIRHLGEIDGRELAIVCTLDHPNEKLIGAYLAAASARELGARRIGLIAPYLSYMRQDKRFRPGEAISSRHVANLLSSSFDWMVTVDPHLHRYKDLREIYAVPTQTANAAPCLSKWIGENVTQPVIIGPDTESQQWVAAVATACGAPYTVMEKSRRGDRDVEITFRDVDSIAGRAPVLVDDIISTGRTMAQAVRSLKRQGIRGITCLAIHGIFAGDAYELLAAEGATIVTCNTVGHSSNRIDLTDRIAQAVIALRAPPESIA